jgi:ABC-2 type transport system permease protein
MIRLNTILVLREPGPVASRLLMPLILIAVLHPLYRAALDDESGAAGTTQIVAGMLVMFSLLALSLVGSAILTERVWRTWNRLRATPAAVWELIAGKMVPSFVILVVQQVLILGLGVVVFSLPVGDLPLLALAVTTWVVTLLCIGTALGTLARSHSELAVFYDIGGLALTVLGGALVPLSLMPGWARTLAPISPGYWAMSSFRTALDGDMAGMMRANMVLIALGVVSAVVAGWRIRKGWGRSRLL